MNNIDTVLFDFDGTVMDTNNVILMSWQHTFRTLRNREEPQENLVKTFGEPLETTMKKFFPDVPVEESVSIYRSFHHDNFSKLIKLFPGMGELIEEVKHRGYKTGLVTSRLLRTTMEGLNKYGLRDRFDTIVTADDTTKHKPDPQPVNIALEKLGSVAERTVMLGDTTFDMLCARNAGVSPILVSWSLALKGKTKEELGEACPDHIIEKPEELLEIIAQKDSGIKKTG